MRRNEYLTRCCWIKQRIDFGGDVTEVCEWKQEGDDDYNDCWNTGCGEVFILIDGTPTENGMMYCCYCGGQIKEVVER